MRVSYTIKVEGPTVSTKEADFTPTEGEGSGGVLALLFLHGVMDELLCSAEQKDEATVTITVNVKDVE